MDGLMFDDGTVAVVTGSTGGIGEAIALRFAGGGARVVVTGRRVDDGKRVEQAIRDAGGQATYIRADLTSEDDVEGLFATTLAAYGPATVLVNNAAPTDLVGPSN